MAEVSSVDLNELLKGAQAHALQRLASGYDFMTNDVQGLQARAFLNKLVSVDLTEAAAAKELGKAGAGTDMATIRAGSNTPPLPTQGG